MPALDNRLRADARADRAIGLRLYVERDNHPAQATYRAMGMHESSYRVYEEFWS